MRVSCHKIVNYCDQVQFVSKLFMDMECHKMSKSIVECRYDLTLRSALKQRSLMAYVTGTVLTEYTLHTAYLFELQKAGIFL